MMPLASYQARLLEALTRGKLASFPERATGETTITDPELDSISDRETLDGTLLTRRQAEALRELGFEPNLTSDPTAFCHLTRCPECGGPLRADFEEWGERALAVADILDPEPDQDVASLLGSAHGSGGESSG